MLNQRELEQVANYMAARSPLGQPNAGGSQRLRRRVSSLLKDVRELDLGWTSPTKYGGGTSVGNNYNALAQSVQEINNRGSGVLAIPAGTLAVQAPSPLALEVPTTIVSFGGTINMSGSTSGLFDVRSQVNVYALSVSSIPSGFAAFDFTDAASEVERFSMTGGEYSGAGGLGLFMDTTGPGMRRVSVDDVWMHDLQFAIFLHNHLIEDVAIEQSFIEDIAENGIWLGRDFAADFENQGNYTVSGSHFHRIGDGSVQPDPDRHAFIGFGRRAVIEGNEIIDVENDTAGDCEGIYVKIREAIVTDNTLHNAGLGQGQIAIKGQPIGSSTPAHNTIVSENTITNDPGRAATSAISVGDPGECHVEGNEIDGMTDTVIVIGGPNQTEVKVRGNKIYRTVANVCVSVNAPTSRFTFEDNTIDDMDGGAGAAAGLLVSNTGVDPYEYVFIKGNTFNDIRGTVSPVCAILDNMTQNPSVRDYQIDQNMFSNLVDGIIFTAPAPRQERLRIGHANRFVNLTGTPISGVPNLLTARTRFYRNIGFVSEAEGIATFAAATSVVVNHGLDWTRRLDRRIVLTPIAAAPGTVPYITAAGAVSFTINIDGGHTGDIAWRVGPQDEIYT